jgi:ABC-2 type transport system ATP-binding protein
MIQPMETIIMKAEALSKSYGDNLALDRLDLEVAAGEVFCMLGANGAGKTTTVSLFLNFIQPSSGRCSIKGLDVQQNPVETKKFLAYIPETVMLYPNMSGFENLEYFVTLARLQNPLSGGANAGKATEQELLAALERAGLPPAAVHRPVGGYSKGMRQKVGIALAIAKQAELLILDEPTSGLDPQASNEFGILLEQLSQAGTAIFMVTHDIFRAKETGTRIGMMKKGKLVELLDAKSIDHSSLESLYLKHMSESRR